MEGCDRKFSVAAQSAPQKATLPQKPPFWGDLVLESHYGRGPPLRQKKPLSPHSGSQSWQWGETLWAYLMISQAFSSCTLKCPLIKDQVILDFFGHVSFQHSSRTGSKVTICVHVIIRKVYLISVPLAFDCPLISDAFWFCNGPALVFSWSWSHIYCGIMCAHVLIRRVSGIAALLSLNTLWLVHWPFVLRAVPRPHSFTQICAAQIVLHTVHSMLCMFCTTRTHCIAFNWPTFTQIWFA